MRFIFKTAYGQDIVLARHGGHVFWYSALGLLLVAAPWIVPEYWLAQLTFVLIYGIVGLGLMLLAGFTGLFSLGHAAFLGVGAYTQAYLTGNGVPFPIAGRFNRFTAARTAAPEIPSSFAASPGLKEAPAGSAAGAASRRRLFNHSAAFPGSASIGKTNPHPTSSAEMRPMVR